MGGSGVRWRELDLLVAFLAGAAVAFLLVSVTLGAALPEPLIPQQVQPQRQPEKEVPS